MRKYTFFQFTLLSAIILAGCEGGPPPPNGPPSPGGGGSSGPTCDACGADATYSEVISTESGYSKRTITSSGCPNHYSYCTGKSGLTGCGDVSAEGTASEAVDNSKIIEIPGEPVIRASSENVACNVGAIAIALNGVSIYSGAVDNECSLLDVEDEDSEWTSFDICSGHAEMTGDYHYHFPPACLISQATATNPTSDGHSPQIGWSFDGFPIYGPKGPSGVLMTHTAEGCTGDYCLDACSGQALEIPSLDNFKYRYYFTGNVGDMYSLPVDPKPEPSHYPFTLACYVGCTFDDLSSGSCTGTSGVTSSYTATATTGYTTEFTDFSPDLKCGTGVAVSTTSPTFSPTTSPTYAAGEPTPYPSDSPTPQPSSSPTFTPSFSPTASPTSSPTFSPTLSPTLSPTVAPTPTFTTASVEGTIDIGGSSVSQNQLTAMEMGMEAEVGRGCDVTVSSGRRRRLEQDTRRLSVTVSFVLSLVMEDNSDLSTSNFFDTISSEVAALVSSGDLENATNTALSGLSGGTFTPMTVESVTPDPDSVSFVESGGGNDDSPYGVNLGDCSDKTYNQCGKNVYDADGDFAYCDMCMCEKFESYGGSGNCEADENLYACYISDSSCKSQLRQSWIIGFSFIAFTGCCVICTMCYFKPLRKKSTSPVSE